MNKIYCVVDSNNEVVNDVYGFLDKEELERDYPSHTVVEMKTDNVPTFIDLFKVIDGKFVPKSPAEIAAIEKPRKDRDALSEKMKTLKATDTDALETVIKFLQR